MCRETAGKGPEKLERKRAENQMVTFMTLKNWKDLMIENTSTTVLYQTRNTRKPLLMRAMNNFTIHRIRTSLIE